MNTSTIRQAVSRVLLAILLAATLVDGLLGPPTGFWSQREWLHTFCLMQVVLLVACAVYGPARFAMRMPFICAWGLGVGFALARLNLISILGRVSLAAGGLLLAAATIGGLLIFVPHRWMTGVSLVFGNHEEHRSLRQKHQLSVRSLLILTAAFAVTAFLARAAVTAPSDPYADDHDILVIHSWLGFFPCLSAAPVLLIIFRPSWRIILVGGFYLVVATLDSVCLGWAAPFMLNDQTIATTITFPNAVETIRQSLLWHGQAVTAIVVYGVLARFSGFRMVLPVQSNDKNPNPSAHPDIEAGCDQD